MRVVKKFGGTSVGNIERIKKIAEIIIESVKNNEQIVVVVSAMNGVTDNLHKELCQVSKINKVYREFDQAMITGEQVSAALLALAINELGYSAKSYNAWSLPIYGDGEYGDGYITEINSIKLKQDLEKNIIPIVTGFQALNKSDNSLLTLGRGGSDYSAVMIAASINADMCYIYTDVDGVYTADPRIVKNAIKIDELSYNEIIDIASSGAKVLQVKSVIAAKKYGIYLNVLSSFNQNSGTIIANNVLLNRTKNLKIISYIDFEDSIKITIMSLDQNEKMGLKEIEQILIENNISFTDLNINDKKITLLINVINKNLIIELLHEFYNKLN